MEISALIHELEHELTDGIHGLGQKVRLADINVLAHIAAVLTAAKELPHEAKHEAAESWKNEDANEIEEELESVASKIAEYKTSGDTALRDMARDELRHAAYYLNNAKMRGGYTQEEIMKYQKYYDDCAKMMNQT